MVSGLGMMAIKWTASWTRDTCVCRRQAGIEEKGEPPASFIQFLLGSF